MKFVWSLPNILTYLRIVAVPAVVAAFYLEDDAGRWVAFGLFAAASITDYFDGYLARLWKQQSTLGRMLDPIADKLLVSVCLLVLTYHGTIGGFSLWAAVIILMREIFVSGLREFLADLKVSVPVTRLAKWKTTLQLVAIGILLLGPTGDKLIDGITELGLVLLWTAALVTLYTGYDYFRSGVVYLMEERHEP
ncbi:CDP-diacylglycerol--glycerol-3-phosphate 3-phosphatidyltransferase [uncultured Pleomorphomonas sp.]|uniref:CDP-diacylglycerol--glycerol-3-phosphate 3-phosphatidyltransferase n=2 Tax=Pleomorphomonas TaxID=261933 RepID=A0A2G9WS39_9HYPH|nr:CDP-diacylglycerol--glycerol-3-phosphate 3-phosphatidyltransferase [Pleomorphomonas carboxyditropha]PIO97142.1 CDP-diacylglycerol--glycerol-3-phosphate 3-phosphatidyltransferase [Pleomorphomonas carboxyditropha]SCM79136.1 CDP-diacylglycerol--glycerol-3-phosphate 3-phosphatidyltransferase [uncultured Pleomorphomonas sp.]